MGKILVQWKTMNNAIMIWVMLTGIIVQIMNKDVDIVVHAELVIKDTVV